MRKEMAHKNSKKKKPTKPADNTRQRRAAQITFALLAVILILSMVLAAVANY